MHDNAHVVAIDVTTAGASVVKCYRDGRTPKVMHIQFPSIDPDTDNTVARMVEIAQTNAKDVVSKAFSGEGTLPSLVGMTKQIILDPHKDPSGPRRSALWWNVAAVVHELGLPLAEVHPITAQILTTGRQALGKRGFDDTARAVQIIYPDLAFPSTKFKQFVVGCAMVAAVACGWSVPVEVTSRVLGSMRSKTTTFPWSIPSTVDEWKQINTEHRSAFTYNALSTIAKGA